jgi:hypothetical protein
MTRVTALFAAACALALLARPATATEAATEVSSADFESPASELEAPFPLNLPVVLQQGEAAANSTCAQCFDKAYEIAWSLFPVLTDSAIFELCVRYCNGNEGCIMVCTVVAEEAWQKELDKLDLDPIYWCQKANLCPVGDCSGDCASAHMEVAPEAGVAPQTFEFSLSVDVKQSWNGTGMIWFQVNQDPGDFYNGTMILNTGRLLEFPLPLGLNNFTFSVDCDDTWADGPNTYTAYALVCEGECSLFGPSRHPHTRMLANASATFGCENDDEGSNRASLFVELPTPVQEEAETDDDA